MADAAIHNRALEAARKRADETLVPNLARLLEPILTRAGREAAAGFQRRATVHLTASSAPTLADLAALRAMPSDLVRPLVASLALHAAGDGVTPTSTMIAVMPRRAEADRIGGDDPPPLMHVTLAYLGQYDGELSDVASALTQVAAGHAPLAGKVGGVGHFADNGNGHPSILLPSVPGLVELRVAVTSALVRGGFDFGREYGFVPHATTGYTSDPVAPDPEKIGEPLHFDSLWVVRGDDERVELPLTGAKPLTAAGEQEPSGWTPPSIDEIFDAQAFIAAVRAKTDPVRQAVVETMMSSVLDGVGLSFDVTNPFTARVLAQSGQHVTSIADTTRADIQQVIDASYQNGLSVGNTAKAIKLAMRQASTVRAEMIARTELVGAVNGGSLAAVQIVGGATGAAYAKAWMTAPGAKYPRHDDYDGLDGQTVELDGYFQVGDSTLQFPGDPDGDPGEVINCRCTMRYEDQGGEDLGDVTADDS